MMQLKYMILAAGKMLANWEPEPSEVHFFWASSNYVQDLNSEDKWKFARLSRVEERDLPTLEAKRKCLHYLKQKVFPLLFKNDRFIETAQACNLERV